MSMRAIAHSCWHEACGTASSTMEAGRRVVSLFGEHDLSTVSALGAMLEEPEAADVVVDLSGVEFMDASTVGVIVHARSFARRAGQELSVRNPSSFASRVLELCQLSDLVAGPVAAPHVPGALASWIGVPARGHLQADRIDLGRLSEIPVDRPQRETATPMPAAAVGSDPSRKSAHGGG